MDYNAWGWLLFTGYTLIDIFYIMLIGGSLAGLELIFVMLIFKKIAEKRMLLSNLRIKILQEKTVLKCDLREQIKAVIEEKNEVIEELEKFLDDHPGEITVFDLRRKLGNIHKEIEDDFATNLKLRLMFIRTYNQRIESFAAKRQIVFQLRDYLKNKGVL